MGRSDHKAHEKSRPMATRRNKMENFCTDGRDLSMFAQQWKLGTENRKLKSLKQKR
jgi:hypothetical protein